jgi:hypothetical protein
MSYFIVPTVIKAPSFSVVRNFPKLVHSPNLKSK